MAAVDAAYQTLEEDFDAWLPEDWSRLVWDLRSAEIGALPGLS